MSNQLKTEALGFFPDELVLMLQTMLAFPSDNAAELEMADDLVKRIEVIPGVDFNEHTNRISYSIAWCDDCQKNVSGKSIRPPIGACPECRGTDLTDAHEIFMKIDKKERIFVWDAVKKDLKGKRTPMLTRKIRRLADAFGKLDEFAILTTPKPEKKAEEPNAGTPETPAGA